MKPLSTFLLIICCYICPAQRFIISNETGFDLYYSISGSVEGTGCSYHSRIHADTTIIFPNIDSVHWECKHAGQVFKPVKYAGFTISGNGGYLDGVRRWDAYVWEPHLGARLRYVWIPYLGDIYIRILEW